jgi:hypothetical protein
VAEGLGAVHCGGQIWIGFTRLFVWLEKSNRRLTIKKILGKEVDEVQMLR